MNIRRSHEATPFSAPTGSGNRTSRPSIGPHSWCSAEWQLHLRLGALRPGQLKVLRGLGRIAQQCGLADARLTTQNTSAGSQARGVG
jgi:hypothetical protein